MPTYQYRCDHCGHEFEEFQSITEEPIAKCPKCSKKPRRIITGGAGFLLKGSGFYSTDYRSQSYKEAAKKEESTKSTSTADSSKSGTKDAKKKSGDSA